MATWWATPTYGVSGTSQPTNTANACLDENAVRTTDGCYVPESDLFEYEGDCEWKRNRLHGVVGHANPSAFFHDAVSAELEFCGEIPLEVTQQRARVRYLAACKWGHSKTADSIAYYGRDEDITVTCWVEAGINSFGEIMGNR